MTAKLKRWSFSQWENYNGCPARWKFKSVLKLPGRPAGPAAARGLHMHKRAEQYILGEIDDPNAPTEERFGNKGQAIIHEKYLTVLDEFKHHPNGERYCEKDLGFDDEFYLCGRASLNAWLIAVLDAARGFNGVVHIAEWKSGEPKTTHADQRLMYALVGLRRWLVDEVRVTTYYLEDTAPPERLVVKATAEDKLKKIWWGRQEQMATDTILAPKPGDQCRWCDYARGKGGPCQFG